MTDNWIEELHARLISNPIVLSATVEPVVRLTVNLTSGRRDGVVGTRQQVEHFVDSLERRTISSG